MLNYITTEMNHHNESSIATLASIRRSCGHCYRFINNSKDDHDNMQKQFYVCNDLHSKLQQRK